MKPSFILDITAYFRECSENILKFINEFVCKVDVLAESTKSLFFLGIINQISKEVTDNL